MSGACLSLAGRRRFPEFKFKLGSISSLDLEAKIYIADIILGLRKSPRSLSSHEWILQREHREKRVPLDPPLQRLSPGRANKSWELRTLLFWDKQRHETGFKASHSTELFQTCEQPVSKGKINLAQTRHSKLSIVYRTLMHFKKRVWHKKRSFKAPANSETELLACINGDNKKSAAFKVALNVTKHSLSTGIFSDDSIYSIKSLKQHLVIMWLSWQNMLIHSSRKCIFWHFQGFVCQAAYTLSGRPAFLFIFLLRYSTLFNTREWKHSVV